MSMYNFDAFKSELVTIKDIVSVHKYRTIRDEDLKGRIQDLFRTWTSVVHPSIENLIPDKKQLLKFSAEVEALAKLTSKCKSTSDYRKHLKKSIELANSICIYLPPSGSENPPMRAIDTFVKGIPDLPSKLVPNSLLGWKRNIESFVAKYPFDKSVFIMIRYRERNKKIIKIIRDTLNKHNLYGVLASDHKLTDDMYNPTACLFCCSKGIVV